MEKLNYSTASEGIINWLSKYVSTSGLNGFVIGISGGIDSALVSTLCAMTGLPLLVIEMPIHQNSTEVTRAKNHIAWLKENFTNVQSCEVDLTNSFDTLSNVLKTSMFNGNVSDASFDFTMANTRARMRMTTLYSYAGMHGLIVAGTGNKVEDFGIGFYTKYGDGGVDISPIADMMKSEVYEMARLLGVNEEIINAKPTDGLHGDDRTDEDQIGASYDELEWAMNYIESCGDLLTPENIESTSDRQQEVLSIFIKMNNSNKHKMIGIPVFKTYNYRA